jgi:putative peptidoglycan lipid II flippase
VAAGVALAPALVALFTPGFVADAAEGAAVDRYSLAVTALRIVFPGTGFLVLASWALGVLNSHRRFFLAYFAPVLWNSAIIAALLVGGRLLLDGGAMEAGGAGLARLLYAACFGVLAGGLLQLAVQLPLVARLLTGFRLSLSTRVTGVRQALAAFGPVVAGRGVAQLGGYLDLLLASLLAAGAVAALGQALQLYLLPLSLFGMSVAAAELPELSRQSRGDGGQLAARVERGLRQSALFTLPTAVGYLVFGYLVVGTILLSGRFGREETWLVALVLAAYSLGLPASTSSRLLQNTFYALGDTRTPAKIAVLRVVTSAAVAVPLMLWLDRFTIPSLLGESPAPGALHLGATGLAVGSVAGAWLELTRLRSKLRHRLPQLTLPLAAQAKMLALSLAACLPAAALWALLPPLHIALTGLAVLTLYATLYLTAAHLLRFPELTPWLRRLRRR